LDEGYECVECGKPSTRRYESPSTAPPRDKLKADVARREAELRALREAAGALIHALRSGTKLTAEDELLALEALVREKP